MTGADDKAGEPDLAKIAKTIFDAPPGKAKKVMDVAFGSLDLEQIKAVFAIFAAEREARMAEMDRLLDQARNKNAIDGADDMTGKRVTVKPLHLVLKPKWFDEFAAGRKTTEWRRHGRRYNQASLPPGRAVTLRRGDTKTRLDGRVIGTHIVAAGDAPPDVRALYAAGRDRRLLG
jgi:hypothetical protein